MSIYFPRFSANSGVVFSGKETPSQPQQNITKPKSQDSFTLTGGSETRLSIDEISKRAGKAKELEKEVTKAEGLLDQHNQGLIDLTNDNELGKLEKSIKRLLILGYQFDKNETLNECLNFFLDKEETERKEKRRQASSRVRAQLQEALARAEKRADEAKQQRQSLVTFVKGSISNREEKSRNSKFKLPPKAYKALEMETIPSNPPSPPLPRSFSSPRLNGD